MEDQRTKVSLLFHCLSLIFHLLKKHLLSRQSMGGLAFKDLPVYRRETCINQKSQCQQELNKIDHVLRGLREGATDSFLA